MRGSLFVAAGVLATLATTTARADPAAAWAFVYEVPGDRCPTRDHAKGLIVARLGFDPFADDRRAASELRIVIEPDGPSGLVARVSRHESGSGATAGERTVKDPTGDCSELVSAAALAGSILVDPTGALANEQRRPRSEPPPSGASTAEDPFAEKPAPPPPPKPIDLGAFVGARTLGSVGTAPSAVVGVSLDVGMRIGRVRLRLEGRGDFSASSDAAADGARARSSIVAGSLVPCWALDPLQLCAVLTLGSVLAESENVTPAESDRTLFAAAGVRPQLEIRVARGWALVASAEILVPFTRLSLVVRRENLWSAPPISGSLGAGVLVHFL